jgi:hypothetical protein
VAQLGDVNLDGIPDFLVGAPGTHIFEHSYVNGWAHICSGVDGSILRTWTGPSPRSLFGMAIASPGDLDGDGIPDVIVGAPNIRTIYVYSGATGAPIALQGTGGSSTQGGGAAHGIRGVGDVDGDGVPDYAYMGFFGQVNEIVVVSGATHAVLLRIPSPEPLLYFGSSLWAAGDVDGDGLPDLIAGSQTSNLYVPARVAMYSLRPQGQAFFGGGCPTASGHEPRIGGTAIPRRGQPFTFNLSRGPPSALAFLLVGTSNTAYGSTPLPFDLSSLGYPGCELLVSAEFVCPTFTFSRGANGGAAELTFQVPNDPLLLGVNFFAQWAVENLPPSLSPLAGTRGIHLVIQ